MTVALTPPRTGVLREILVTTDFSPAANAALAYAAGLARQHGARLHVAHMVWVHEADALPEVAYPTLAWMARVGQQQLDQIQHGATLVDVEHSTCLLRGRPIDVLPDLVRTEKIDLAVIGSNGRTGMGRLLLGSTSETVLRMLSCPVVTLGPHAWDMPRPAEPHHILIASHLDPGAEAMVTRALHLTQEYQAQLTLLHVLRPGAADGSARYEHARRQLRELLPAGAGLWSPPEIRVEVGLPAQWIIQAATEIHADLIVLGARAGGELAARAGGTVQTVICAATAPVMTLRHG